ncbi:MAG: ABC transporter substrate-binding protein [Syntrophorhabdaceae bacterium]
MVTNPAFCTFMILAFILGFGGCQQKGTQGPPLELTLATEASAYSGLIAVADDKGFFEEAGLKVRINYYPSGRDALKAMMSGEGQVATVTDIAFANMMDEDASLRVIASIGTSIGSKIVARKDKNIHKPSDLKGRRIGYSPGTSSEYFLGVFLLTNHMSWKDVRPVAIPPARQVEAVVTGEIDAVSAFERYAFLAQKKLSDNGISWSSQNTLAFQWLLVTRESSTKSPEAIKRLLKALLKAQELVVKNPDETQAIIARKWDIDREFIRDSWNYNRLFVSFNQSIVIAVQSYLKWHMDREGKRANPPDIYPYLYPRALDEINPRLVTISRETR